MISVLLHLYYPESIKTVLPQISLEFLEGTRFYVNMVSGVPFDESAFSKYENLTITRSPNVGKDIGGKLVLIDSLLSQQDDSKYWIFLHDKHSPHTTTGKFWRDSLFSIADIQNKETILKQMAREEVGAITHKLFVRNEWDQKKQRFDTINHEILVELLNKYPINPGSFEFAAGTMFWAKSAPMKSFFTAHSPLQIRATLEKGNVLDHHTGTQAHSWERLLSWIAMSNNKKIIGIE